MLAEALNAAEEINASVVNMRFVKPLDTEMLHSIASTHDLIVTLEENVIAGGAGSGVNEWLLANKFNNRVINLGLPDRFVEHGATHQLLAECGLDAEGILKSIKAETNSK